MGYDISVRFNDKEEVLVMLSFLETVQTELMKLEATERMPFKLNFNTDKDVGVYAPTKNRDCLISMHGTGIPYYAWTLCSWMAHKSAYRNKQGLPVIYYDREEITVHGKDAAINHLRADDNGILIRDRPASLSQTLAKALKIGPDYEVQLSVMQELNNKYESYLNELQNEFKFEI